ncbi:MAG: NAD(P)H-hydrate dehydratase [Thermoflavifilum sp.]|nr:NAD(P)H-hydrate dehydratase [Thermoflavifilum sp.]
MKILRSPEIRAADAYTIAHEPISSLELMERAATRCVEWITAHFSTDYPFRICCGTGNNGGDGLAIARLLLEKGYRVNCLLILSRPTLSPDCTTNLQRLESIGHHPLRIQHAHEFPMPDAREILIDAVLGTGITRPAEGLIGEYIHWVNDLSNTRIAIDLPTGMPAEGNMEKFPCVKAQYTLTFQQVKLNFMLPHSGVYAGEVIVLDIGLDRQFWESASTPYYTIDISLIQSIYRIRQAFTHKGSYGHAVLVCGSKGKMGAAVLAAGACLRAGTGLLTSCVPAEGYAILQQTHPEALCAVLDPALSFSDILGEASRYRGAGIGPGIGTSALSTHWLTQFFSWYRRPLVLDADALNLIAQHPEMFSLIPTHSILTPHPKEFERLFGTTANDYERLELLQAKAQALQLIIILKDHHSCVAMPDGRCYFNTTGNPGMATGGSGDVLTGLLTGLLAQSYSPEEAALLGVYVHGLAGDLAAAQVSEEALLAGDLVNYLGKAFQMIRHSLPAHQRFFR